MAEIMIQHGSNVYIPTVEGGVNWSTERVGVPGKITFGYIKDDVVFAEGDAVLLKDDGDKVAYGFIFDKGETKSDVIHVTVYDQLRYLKNKDTYVYTNKTANQFLKMVASDYQMNLGTIESTGYTIASRVEDNSTLFDMIQNALDVTLQNTGQLYVLYDDVGRLTLKNIESMRLNILIDEETGENFSYKSSIDESTYNRIKLIRENEETGMRDVYVAQDGGNMNAWGVLQYFDKLKEGENGTAKANALLSLYNKKTRKLTLNNAFGHNSVRAGCMLVVKMQLNDMEIKNLMLVEKCKHKYNNDEHFMDLTLRGGEFVG